MHTTVSKGRQARAQEAPGTLPQTQVQSRRRAEKTCAQPAQHTLYEWVGCRKRMQDPSSTPSSSNPGHEKPRKTREVWWCVQPVACGDWPGQEAPTCAPQTREQSLCWGDTDTQRDGIRLCAFNMTKVLSI